MKVILYSTKCPKCMVLEQRLKMKGVEYKEVNDEAEMFFKGFTSAPMLEVDGTTYDFMGALGWLKELKNEH